MCHLISLFRDLVWGWIDGHKTITIKLHTVLEKRVKELDGRDIQVSSGHEAVRDVYLKPAFYMIVRIVPKYVQTIETIIWKHLRDDRTLRRSKSTRRPQPSLFQEFVHFILWHHSQVLNLTPRFSWRRCKSTDAF